MPILSHQHRINVLIIERDLAIGFLLSVVIVVFLGILAINILAGIADRRMKSGYYSMFRTKSQIVNLLGEPKPVGKRGDYGFPVL
jgi:hypothetical protein